MRVNGQLFVCERCKEIATEIYLEGIKIDFNKERYCKHCSGKLLFPYQIK